MSSKSLKRYLAVALGLMIAVPTAFGFAGTAVGSPVARATKVAEGHFMLKGSDGKKRRIIIQAKRVRDQSGVEEWAQLLIFICRDFRKCDEPDFVKPIDPDEVVVDSELKEASIRSDFAGIKIELDFKDDGLGFIGHQYSLLPPAYLGVARAEQMTVTGRVGSKCQKSEGWALIEAWAYQDYELHARPEPDSPPDYMHARRGNKPVCLSI